MAEKPGNAGMFKRECNVFKIFMFHQNICIISVLFIFVNCCEARQRCYKLKDWFNIQFQPRQPDAAWQQSIEIHKQ